jgi:T5SS/PEP-CTERM-associated repeat protein
MRLLPSTIGVLVVALCAAPTRAAVTWGGSYSPDPWVTETTAYVGYQGNGSLTIDQTGTPGGLVKAAIGVIGGSTSAYSSAVGTVAVIGGAATSQFQCFSDLYAGYFGTGNVYVSSGGSLGPDSSDYIADQAGSSGTASVSGAGSSWTTYNMYVGQSGSGSLTVSNGGLVVVYSNQGFYVGVNSTASGTVTIGHGGTIEAYNTCIGNAGVGTVNVVNGGTFEGTGAPAQLWVANASGSQGTLNISGAGSSCTLGNWGYPDLNMGTSGAYGRISITSGGALNTRGYDDIAFGTNELSIDGAGSTWTNTATGGGGVQLDNGGAVYISGGAAVSVPSVAVGTGSSSNGSLLEIDAGRGSSLAIGSALSIGTGSGSSGILRLVAGADAAATTYTPISAGTWTTGTATYQPVGGTWNSFTHQFTVSGTLLSPASIDTSVYQRALWSDSNGNSLGASFLAAASTNVIYPTVAALAGSASPPVSGGQVLLGDWGLSGVTTSSSNPVYLSLSANAYCTNTLWCYDGASWSQVTGTNACDLTFDGTHYSFGLSGSAGSGLGFGGYDYAVVGTPLLAGDANLDGRVDVNDLTIVLAHFGQVGTGWSQGEFTGDGTVDVNDLTIVLAHFGQAVASGPVIGLGAVPEPGALLLLAAGLTGLLTWGWRRKCRAA